MLKAAFFDFAGTIFHAERVHMDAVRSVIERHTNTTVDDDELRAYVGLPYADRIEHMLAMRGIADDALTAKLENVAQQYRAEHMDLQHLLVPGVETLIKSLNNAEVLLAVVSSGTRSRIESDLREVGLRKYFHAITAIEDVTCRKPHPEPYEKTLEKLGVNAQQTVAFEDSPPGTEAAQLAGIPVVGLLTTFEEPDLHRAQRTIHDFTQITLDDLRTMI